MINADRAYKSFSHLSFIFYFLFVHLQEIPMTLYGVFI